MKKPSLARRWTLAAIGSGLLACLSYSLLALLPMPKVLTVVVAATFGPALGVASLGLYQFLKLHQETVCAQIAAASNVVAGALVTAMLLVQLALRFPLDDHLARQGADEAARRIVNWVWYVDLGLDVAFDIYIGLGTFLFGVSLLRHPRFGRVIGWAGILIALLLLAFNFYTFPDPPSESGLLDAGPLIGLWYLAVVILMARSLKWVEGHS